MSNGERLFCRQCERLNAQFGGTPACMDEWCLVQFLRADLRPTILGRPTRSPLVLPVFFSIEPGDDGRTLNLGEAVLRQEETQTVMRVLRDNGIIVTALHNHWLFEEPRLMYMHWEAVMDPRRFLRISLAALEAAGVRIRPLAPPMGREEERDDPDDRSGREERFGRERRRRREEREESGEREQREF